MITCDRWSTVHGPVRYMVQYFNIDIDRDAYLRDAYVMHTNVMHTYELLLLVIY